MPHEYELCLGFFIIAILYSSVGHAGASGYIAMLTLAGWGAHDIRPLALLLNVSVASIATVKFYRAGFFRRELFIPVVLLAVPCAAIGGYIQPPGKILPRLMGAALWFSALWLLTGKREPENVRLPGKISMLMSGGSIGFLAGITGTGGGIFLSPLMLILRWAKLKEISAIAAPYILLNSLAGLSGLIYRGQQPSGQWLLYLPMTLAGGYLGSTLGAKIFNRHILQLLLSVVLLLAGVKLLLV